MSDHNEQKEALEAAANAALDAAGAGWHIAYTRKGAWSVAADGSVTPPTFATAVKRVVATEPPTDPVESDPPTDPIEPPMPDDGNGTHPAIVTGVDSLGRQWYAQAMVGDDPTVAGILRRFALADGTEHAGLEARIYADCVDVGATRADNPYDWMNRKISVSYDGADVAVPPSSYADGHVDFWRGCLFTVRYGTQVQWDASKIDWSLYPNYDRTPLPAYNDSKRDYSFNGLGGVSTAGMAGTGERDEIGYEMVQHVAFLLDPCDDTWDVVRRVADHDGKWGCFFTDPETGGILDVETYPYATLLSQQQRLPAKYPNPIVVYAGKRDGDTVTPPDTWQISACPHQPNGAHLTSFAMLPAMITGSARDRDHASLWANYPLLEIGPTYRQSGGVMYGAQRRAAWCLRSLFMAGYVSSDQGYFQRRTARQLEVIQPIIGRNPFGILDTQFSYTGTGSAAGCTGVAIWMQSYVMQTLDAVANKLPEWRPFAQYLGGFYARWGAKAHAPLATIYAWICRDADKNLIADEMLVLKHSLVTAAWNEDLATRITDPDLTAEQVYTLLQEYYAKSNWGGKCVDGVSDYRGAITSPDSYPASVIMATIAAYNVGTQDCEAALQHVLNLPTKPDYSHNSKYRLAPRPRTA